MRALVELRAEWPDPVIEFRRPQCSWSGQCWGSKAGKMSHPKSDGSGGDGQAASAIVGPESRSHDAFQFGRLMLSHSRNIGHFSECSNQSSVGFIGRRHFLGAVLAALLILVGVSSLRAQSDSTGGLGGTITGAKGALPDATVVLTNNATNQTATVVSGTNGSYRFSLLVPGTYRVTFSAPGFKTSEVPSITVNVSEAPTLDASLEPGDPRQTIACNCRLSMSASSTGTLVDHKTITGVPLTTRNFAQVLSMTSGTAADVNNAGTLGRGNSTVNVNGSTAAGSYTIEGAYPPSTVPNPDTIAEFKIQTSQYDAGYGAMVPSTTVITRAGENLYHGTAWEFVRNDIFNANAFFRNATGQPKPNLKQNQFGVSLGGPIRKDKWFFFGSYQGTRQVNGLDPTSVATVILPPLTIDRSAATLAAQFCPGNHLLASGTGGGQPDPNYLTFAGGKQLDCANQNTATTAAIDPVALNILQAKLPNGSYMIPVPQTILQSGTNAGMGFSSFSFPSYYNEDHFIANSDYVASPVNTLSWRGFFSRINQLRSLGAPGGATVTPVIPGDGSPQALHAQDDAVSFKLTSVLTPKVVNEARFAYTRTLQYARGVGIPSADSFGMTPVDPMFPLAPEVTMLGAMGTFRFFGNGANDFWTLTNTFAWTDILSLVHGRHNARVGGVFLVQYNDRLDTGAARGKLTFETFEDLLVGLSAADNQSPGGRSNIETVRANEGVGPKGEVQYQYRHFYGAGFAQDDFKATPRLALNAGLRWEYIGPSSDAKGTIGNVRPSLLKQSPIPPISGTLAGDVVAANYNPALVNPYTGEPFGPPPTGVLTAHTRSFYQNNTPLAKFAPRAGFAWQPFGAAGRVAVRGGYGWFYQAPAYSANAGNAALFTAAPYAQGFTNNDSSNGASNLEKPFPTTTLGFVPRTLTSQLSDRIAGPEYKIPALQQWNLSVQTKLPRAFSFDIGYVGSYGGNLLVGVGLNQPVLASANNPANCGYTGVPSDCITSNTAVNAELRVPFVGENPSALTDSEFTGESRYNGLQVTLRRQMSHGLTFQSAYTLSKSMNDTSIFNDLNYLSRNWARASFDRTERSVTNFDYQFPYSASRQGAAGKLLNGWSTTGIIILQSGLPLTLTDPNGGSVYGDASPSTVTLCPGRMPAALATSGSLESKIGDWINMSAVCSAPAIGSDGSTGYGNAGQSLLDGPPQVNTDFSLGKRTVVGGLSENAELAFRAEFYNSLNHPQFSNPGTTLGTANFGVITQTSVAPRLIQFGLKYLF